MNNATKTKKRDESNGWLGSWCSLCGPDVRLDEDGCCKSCGIDAVGDGADAAIRHRGALRNVMALARMIQRYPGKYSRAAIAEHLLRFCASAGVVPSVLRSKT